MNRKSGVLLSYLLIFLEVMSTLLLTPYITSTLGVAEFGVYKLVVSVTGYLLLLDLGIGNAVIRYISKYKANGEYENSCKFLGVCIIFYTLISVFVVLFGLILMNNLDLLFGKGLSIAELELCKKLMIFTILNILITLSTTVFSNVIIAYSKFILSKGISIIQLILRFLLTILALKLGFGSLALVVITLILTLITRLYTIYYVIKKIRLKPIFKNVEFSLVKDIVVYSSFILLQMIATQINSCADQVLLGTLVESSATIIGIYSIGAQLVQYFQTFGSAITGILMPGVVKLVESGADSTRLQNEMVRVGRFSLSVLGLLYIGFIVNGKIFINEWVGDTYNFSYYVAAILMGAYLVIQVESIGTQILWAQNNHKSQSIIKIYVVVVNVFLTMLLIKWNPIIGATLGTFISLLIGDIIAMNYVFWKDVKISLLEYYRDLFHGIGKCLILTLLSGWIINLLNINSILGLIFNIIVMTSVYTICMWKFGLNENEKNVFINIINRIKIPNRKE